MKYFWLLGFLFGSFNSLWSQEVQHAPTVEQCRADQRLWLHDLEEVSLQPDYFTISNWSSEMDQCISSIL